MALPSTFRPRLRVVDSFAVQVEGKTMVGLADPSRVAPDSILLSLGAVALLTKMDGDRDLAAIQAVLALEGNPVSMEVISGLVEALDQQLFLDSVRYREALRKIEDDFAKAPVREAMLAGRAYPMDSLDLRTQFAAYDTQPDGPRRKTAAAAPLATPAASDRPVVAIASTASDIPVVAVAPAASGSAAADVAPVTSAGPPASVGPAAAPSPGAGASPRAIIAPHIDPPRGGPVYAQAYGAVAGTSADLAIVLGTSHTGTGFYFTLTRKDYQTPLGPAKTDQALIDRLEARHGTALFTGEVAHRSEHSLEFAALWLRFTWPGREFTILPILCGAGHETLMRGGSLAADPLYGELIASLREITQERPTLLVASADLSHMGPRFGDAQSQGAAERAALEVDDMRMLGCITAGDAEAFLANVWTEKDRRKVCGFLPIYAMLRIMGTCTGRVLAYKQWPDPAAVVSYAAVTFP